MPDEKVQSTDLAPVSTAGRLPILTFVWLIITVLVFVISQQTVTMRDEERFPGDFELAMVETESENTALLNIVAGTFEYNDVSQVSNEVETGTFAPDTDHPVAAQLFGSVPDLIEVTIEPQTITLVYDNDIELDLMLRRTQRPIVNAVLNGG